MCTVCDTPLWLFVLGTSERRKRQMKFSTMALFGLTFLVAAQVCTASASSAAANSTRHRHKHGRKSNDGLKTVLKMLEGIEAETRAAMEEADAAYKVIEADCKNRTEELRKLLMETSRRKLSYEVLLAKLKATYGGLEKYYEEFAYKVTLEKNALWKAKKQREKDKADFEANEADLVYSIKSLKGAIAILERELANNPNDFQISELLQKNFENVSEAIKAMAEASFLDSQSAPKLMALVQSGQQSSEDSSPDDDDSLGVPQAETYTHQTRPIIKILDGMLKMFMKRLEDARGTESEAVSQHIQKRIRLGEDIAVDEEGRVVAKRRKRSTEGEITEADWAEETEEEKLARIEKALKEFMQQCMLAAEKHDTQRKNRAEEIEAVKKAHDFLTDGMAPMVECGECPRNLRPCANEAPHVKIGNECCACADGTATELLTTSTAAPTEGGASFLQLKLSSKTELKDAELQSSSNAVQFLKAFAQKEHSVDLAQLANQMQTAIKLDSAVGDDPFVKVKGLIRQMIAKLKADDDAATTEKEYCDTNIRTTTDRKSVV